MRVKLSVSWLVALLVVSALVAGTAGSAAATEPLDTGTVETGSSISSDSVAYHCLMPAMVVGAPAIFEYAERLSKQRGLHACTPTGPTFPV